MISIKGATTIITEKDETKRNELVDRLSEEDAKHLLKKCLVVMRGKVNNETAP
ncbi:hypothetical protein [Anaerotignum propionicum]|uniref:hypothetical protein n=1 Tax=Anaerotignum propionicum TaxID=28446 RepID=UPI002109AFB2|nr:hypothetical protein [Anaerotignum propionicum]MCQ4935051.1 hypothetical protein [Anaerotignum propionicum]